MEDAKKDKMADMSSWRKPPSPPPPFFFFLGSTVLGKTAMVHSGPYYKDAFVTCLKEDILMKSLLCRSCIPDAGYKWASWPEKRGI